MPRQLFLCLPLLKDIIDFTTANRPQVTGKLLASGHKQAPTII
jgi:hypothetical protein